MKLYLDRAGVSEVLSVVLDGIFMASQLATGLWEALAFRVWWSSHERVHKRQGTDSGFPSP